MYIIPEILASQKCYVRLKMLSYFCNLGCDIIQRICANLLLQYFTLCLLLLLFKFVCFDI